MAKPVTDKFIGKTVAGKYRIDSVLRSSELGRVYNATHLLMDRPVTVKVLSPVFSVDDKIVGRFTDEARTLSNFSHPNILNVTDFGTEPDGDTYIVYDGVGGITLKDEIVVEGAFPVKRALDIAEQVAAGLVAAHARGVMHGCLGGDKVMLSKDAEGSEVIKIIELGTATSGEAVLAASESSLEYLSPEQCADPANFDARADVYSLGVMIYEMLTGEVPFVGSNAGELMMKQATQPPPPLSSFRNDIPSALETIVMSALARNRDLRYQTMSDLLGDIASVRESVAAPVSVSDPASDENNIWKTAFIVLAGVSVLSIGLIYITYVRQTDPETVIATDSGAMPVQPINPATGINEQGFASIIPMSTESLQQMTPMAMPSPMADPLAGGGDGYNPWAGGGPPPGAPPAFIPPGGRVVTVEPGNSQFMPPDGSYLPTDPQPAPQPQPTPAPKAPEAGSGQQGGESKPSGTPRPPANQNP